MYSVDELKEKTWFIREKVYNRLSKSQFYSIKRLKEIYIKELKEVNL